MKKYVIIVFLLFAGASYGQAPRIDSMFVDESKGQLHVYGSFGMAKGKLAVDTVQLSISSWSDTLIICEIPDSGKGSGGVVITENSFGKSAPILLTKWDLAIDWVDIWNHTGSNGFSPTQISDAQQIFWNIFFRTSIDSNLNRKAIYVLNCQRISNGFWSISHDSQGGIPDYQTVHQVGRGTLFWEDENMPLAPSHMSAHGVFDFVNDTCSITISSFCFGIDSTYEHHLEKGQTWVSSVTVDTAFSLQHDHAISFVLDPLFKVILGQDQNNYGISKSVVSSPPSLPARMLRVKPSLLLPISGSLFAYRDNIRLAWDSLALMTSYHVGVSTDSLFGTNSVDTTVSDRSFTIPPLLGLTKYFWRVSGINSDGESRWSDVWNFTTGATADVANPQTSTFTFSAYPNPASDKLTIAYSVSGDVNIALYDLPGNKVRTLSQQLNGAQTAELPIAGLPAGMYVLEIKSAGVHKSLPISIVR
jgi:hypothetical protein